MTLGEKVAYLKGLADASNLDDSPISKIAKEIIDTLAEVASSIDSLEIDLSELSDQVDAIDEDLEDLELDYYDDDECGCGCGDDCDCDDEHFFEVTCPSCGDTICLDEEILAEGSIDCPNCKEELEFDFDENDDEPEEDN